MPLRTVEDLQQAIDRHGGDLTRWPAALRDEAATLIANSAAAREKLEAAIKLDSALSAPSDVTAPPGLADRIARAAFQKRPPKSRS